MTFELHLGDCVDVLRGMKDNSVDSIVTDPPYGLTTNKKGGTGSASVNLESPYGRARIGTGNGSGGFMGMKWDSDVPGVDIWRECFRVLKPHGTLIFKWCEAEIPLREVLALTPEKPLYGHRSGKKAQTHWVAFMKPNA